VNRNMIGAVVGVQPFGGEGLSGTGPKAGGPLYLYRLLSAYPADDPGSRVEPGKSYPLPGPTGESNTYVVSARERVLCLAADAEDLRVQLAAVQKLGSRAIRAAQDTDWSAAEFDAVLYHGPPSGLPAVLAKVAERPGPIVPVHAYPPGTRRIRLERLFVERVISVNTAAAGGNASLMAIG
jgi:RHH-type proline utilization regulon transcriptional repressor/proline dehydrogenase/delta 1-pyrroline-5-carboxylate dehydrogenase